MVIFLPFQTLLNSQKYLRSGTEDSRSRTGDPATSTQDLGSCERAEGSPGHCSQTQEEYPGLSVRLSHCPDTRLCDKPRCRG